LVLKTRYHHEQRIVGDGNASQCDITDASRRNEAMGSTGAGLRSYIFEILYFLNVNEKSDTLGEIVVNLSLITTFSLDNSQHLPTIRVFYVTSLCYVMFNEQ
jgi:hypothetical protein